MAIFSEAHDALKFWISLQLNMCSTVLARIGAVMGAYENERQISGLLGSHSVDVVSFSCSLGGS
jgi:hypothetical protein